MHYSVEIIREHLSPDQVLAIRAEAKREGKKVNVTRLLNGLVEIELKEYENTAGTEQRHGFLLN